MAEKTKFNVPEKKPHVLGWNCSNCFHVLKAADGSPQMICTRNPPTAQLLMNSQGQPMGTASVKVPVSDGEWCGEWADNSQFKLQ